MQGDHDYGDEINGIAFRDILMNTLLGVFAILVAVITMIKMEQQAKATAEPPGNLSVSIVWPSGDWDIDLWVWGPAEPVPVGYSNRNGILWNLLRDDLGTIADATELNFETSYTRGIVPGEYSISIHCYRCPVLPVTVEAVVSMNDQSTNGKSSNKTLLTSKVELVRQGQEKTVANFKLLPDGTIDQKTLNNVFKPLRSAGKQ